MVIDDYSRYLVTKLLRKKSDAGNALIEVINQLEAAINLRVSQIQADWGGEFRNKGLQEELKQRGITSKETVPRHSETNAAIERSNWTILIMSHTAPIAAELPKGLCGKASA